WSRLIRSVTTHFDALASSARQMLFGDSAARRFFLMLLSRSGEFTAQGAPLPGTDVGSPTSSSAMPMTSTSGGFEPPMGGPVFNCESLLDISMGITFAADFVRDPQEEQAERFLTSVGAVLTSVHALLSL